MKINFSSIKKFVKSIFSISLITLTIGIYSCNNKKTTIHAKNTVELYNYIKEPLLKTLIYKSNTFSLEEGKGQGFVYRFKGSEEDSLIYEIKLYRFPKKDGNLVEIKNSTLMEATYGDSTRVSLKEFIIKMISHEDADSKKPMTSEIFMNTEEYNWKLNHIKDDVFLLEIRSDQKKWSVKL